MLQLLLSGCYFGLFLSSLSFFFQIVGMCCGLCFVAVGTVFFFCDGACVCHKKNGIGLVPEITVEIQANLMCP